MSSFRMDLSFNFLIIHMYRCGDDSTLLKWDINGEFVSLYIANFKFFLNLIYPYSNFETLALKDSII